MLRIGDVFMWSNYQHVRDPHKKDRWFIYLGETKEINGELFFKFKKEWHKVIDFTSKLTSEFKG